MFVFLKFYAFKNMRDEEQELFKSMHQKGEKIIYKRKQKECSV